MTKIYLVLTTVDKSYDGAIVYVNKAEAEAEAEKLNKRLAEAEMTMRAYVQELTVKA